MRPVAALTTAVVLAVTLSACESERIPELPLTWNSTGEDVGSITLRPDRTGTFIKVPHGAGDDCAAGGQFALTGDFTWRSMPHHGYIASIGDSEVYFGPHSVPFDFSWDKIVVYTCEGRTGFDDPITTYTTFIPPDAGSD